MKRLQISIDPKLDRLLADEARVLGVSKAEVVRDCVRRRLARVPLEEDPFFKNMGALKGPGLRSDETIDETIYGLKDPER